jgi:hypothetical protein
VAAVKKTMIAAPVAGAFCDVGVDVGFASFNLDEKTTLARALP